MVGTYDVNSFISIVFYSIMFHDLEFRGSWWNTLELHMKLCGLIWNPIGIKWNSSEWHQFP